MQVLYGSVVGLRGEWVMTLGLTAEEECDGMNESLQIISPSPSLTRPGPPLCCVVCGGTIDVTQHIQPLKTGNVTWAD